MGDSGSSACCTIHLRWSYLDQGSATVCILVLEGARLHAANLGDSGFWVLRGRRVVHRSPQQQHACNWPFQLGSPGSRSDTPSSADVRHQMLTAPYKSHLTACVTQKGESCVFCRQQQSDAAARAQRAADGVLATVISVIVCAIHAS